MQKNKLFKKAVSLALSAAVLGTTIVTGVPASAEDSALITNQTVTGDATYISTYMKSDYSAGKTAFEISFKYNSFGTVASDNTVGFNDTFEFLVFDTSWGGWNATKVGPNGIDQTGNLTATDLVAGTEYTVTVPISTIEGKLSTDKAAYGINLQTGGIGNSSVTITSMKYKTGTVESQPTVLEGAWHKTNDEDVDCGTMELKSGFANVYANAWNISVSGFSVATFTKPIVAVTVEYAASAIGDDPIYPQAEILDSSTYQPVVANYPQVTKAGTVTYLTEIPETMTSMLLAYDTCTVKKVEIYDEAEEYTTAKTGLTNATITDAICAGYNLGNALDSTSEGNTGETLWGNPEIDKRLFKEIAAAGFKTVRIPVTWIDAVDIDDASLNTTKYNQILNRVKEVVDMAIDYDLFVIINIHHDGAEGVTGRWLDVDAADQADIQDVFRDLWDGIANKFADYDQHLIFESMNEVMEANNYGTPSDTTWNNINDLNQLFVNRVRGKGGNNSTRFLLVPGYNTNIAQTITNKFVMPKYNNSTANEMVSVHFYDPYNFTLNTGSGSTTTITDDDLDSIASQFNDLKTTFVDNGIPVVVGEFCAANKGNIPQITTYISKIVEQAHAKGLAHIYWDNGYDGTNGMALWNRSTYARTELGEALIPVLTSCSE